MIHLDKATHTYYRDGKPVRGVSQILLASGFKKPFYGKSNEAMELGSAVHEMTEHMDWGEDGAHTYDPRVLAYRPGWLAFRQHFPFHILDIERSLYSERWDYCGTPDLVVEFEGAAGRRIRGIVEKKTGHEYDWHPLQTALYAELAQATKRLICYLDPRFPLGFEAAYHTDSRDWQRAQAALITTQGMPLQKRSAT